MVWAPDYAQTSDLKSYLRIDDSDDDAQIGLAITAASRAADRYCNRQFGVTDGLEERSYTAAWDRRRRRWVVEIDDLMTVVGLEITTDAGTIDAYQLEPINAEFQTQPWTRVVVDPASAVAPTTDENGVQVTATFGWSAVPTPVKQATLLQASRIFKRRDAPFGVAGSPQEGSELRLLARVDPDVEVALGPYRRWWAAV